MDNTPAPDDTKLLILALEFPEDTLTEAIRPEKNYIATQILARLLDARLEVCGQFVRPTVCIGPFNHSLYKCFGRDVNAAAKTVWRAIQKIPVAPLEAGAKLYRFDPSENVLRCVIPASGDVVSLGELSRKEFIAGDLSKKTASELSQLLESWLKQAGQTGGEQKQ